MATREPSLSRGDASNSVGQGVSPRALVFDIGGTYTRAAVFDVESGALGNQRSEATPNFLGRTSVDSRKLLADVIATVDVLARELLVGAQPDVVVVGYPGPVTPAGVALRSPTILGTADETRADIAASLQALWPDAVVAVLNDLTCSGYAYVEAGYRDFCLLTVSSGIGNKVFLDGRPIVGEQGHGGEIGHLTLAPRLHSPIADIEGEVGELSSGRGVVRVAQKWAERRPDEFHNSALGRLAKGSTKSINSHLVAQAFRSKDGLALAIVEEASYPLAVSMGAIHLAIGIQTFFIIGGFAKALGPAYGHLLAEIASRTTWDIGQKWREMIQLGLEHEEEGLMGAGYYGARLWRRSSVG